MSCELPDVGRFASLGFHPLPLSICNLWFVGLVISLSWVMGAEGLRRGRFEGVHMRMCLWCQNTPWRTGRCAEGCRDSTGLVGVVVLTNAPMSDVLLLLLYLSDTALTSYFHSLRLFFFPFPPSFLFLWFRGCGPGALPWARFGVRVLGRLFGVANIASESLSLSLS